EPEQKSFAGKVLRLSVCTMEGAEWVEEVPEDTAVEALKERCLQHCLPGSLEDSKAVPPHKLIHVASKKVLTDTKTLLEENIQDRDVLLLLKKRVPPPPPKTADASAEEKRKQEQKAPDMDAILKATAHLPSHKGRPVTRHNRRDFQTELRKILVSLTEVALRLLALNPDAVELLKKANAMLDEEDRVDEISLRQLTEMGFPETRAVKALRLNHMSVTRAMEWLMEHADDPAVDAPLPGQTASEATAEADAASAPTTAGASSEADGEEANDELTKLFKEIRRKRAFRPDPRAVIALMEMGFDEKEVVDALRVNNNQQNAACEWLLGDRKPSPEDLDKGIDRNSPLLQAILEDPVVQLGLNKPKILLAFEDMLANPLNSTQWMNDPDTGPVMLQISRIFQTLDRT
ncbi:UBAC1 protein, partial [Crotophaga sulcirostris]|nr:UBAC1 protein [Crotophaga sulcirostris]